MSDEGVSKKDAKSDVFDDTNAEVMASIISDPTTSEHVKLMILNTLLEIEKDATFFEQMFKGDMTFCRCPRCEHKNHWLIPEDDLNQMGHATFEEDERVKPHTTEADCPRYREACAKKKTSA
jgi:hypothetical protein